MALTFSARDEEKKSAERKGFEPSKRYSRLHTFQACSLNHSDTSLYKMECKFINSVEKPLKHLQWSLRLLHPGFFRGHRQQFLPQA